MTEYLCWIDIETSGLNPTQDVILEVGFIITDLDLTEKDRASFLFDFPSTVWLSDFIKDMHTKNGLLQEIGGTHPDVLAGSFEKANKFLLDWYNNGENVLYPAGSSVHFDVDFLRRYGWATHALYHRHFDVSSIKMFYALLQQAPYDPGAPDPHRAIADLENDMLAVRQMELELLRKQNRGQLG